MSATLTPEAPLSVSRARQLLRDTKGVPPERTAQAERTVAAFYAARPGNRPCVACGSMIWTEHATASGDVAWACAGCHRPASLSADEWQAQRAAAEAVRQVQEARDAAAAPRTPRSPRRRPGGPPGGPAGPRPARPSAARRPARPGRRAGEARRRRRGDEDGGVRRYRAARGVLDDE